MSNSALAPGVVLRSPKREYTIRRVLGQGGFGITYLVDTPLKLENISFKGKFAIKEHFLSMLCAREPGTSNIHYLPNSTEEVQRSQKAFIAEAQRLQKLGINHHNIVEVNEVFEYNKTAYYVMEYIDGGSLADYVRAHGGRLSWAETTRLIRPICEAVAMLHSNMVAHYDIKPQNIMIQQDEDGLRPVLIDFGLAKHYDGQGQATSSIAAAGYTPSYAPMEQYAGIQEFSPTADVYSLAATICFCLTGHAPAKADKLNLDALCDELLALGVSDDVANVLLQAMELRATDRPADAGALTASLFNGAPLQTIRKQRSGGGGGGTTTNVKDRPTTVPESPATAPRRRWLVPAVAAAAVALTAIIFFATRGGDDSATPDTDTVQIASVADTIRITTTETVRVEHPAQPDQPVQQPVAQQPQPQKQETSSTNSSRQQQTPQPAQQPVQQPVAQQPAAQQPNYRTTPRNLDLQVIYNGEKYYFNQSEWNNLSSSVRNSCTKRGVVIDYNGVKSFVVKLNMERHGSGFDIRFTWDEAKRWVNNMSGNWRLPTKDEGKAMADQYTSVNSALKAFGGDNGYWYWTSNEYDASRAWYFGLVSGCVGNRSLSHTGCVRAVCAI